MNTRQSSCTQTSSMQPSLRNKILSNCRASKQPSLLKMAQQLPRGGARQKAQWLREQAAGQQESHQGHLASYLLEKRAWGDISTPTMQQIAAAALADGAKCPMLEKIASIGTSGQHPQNCERDLLCSLKPTPLAQAMTTVRLPMQSTFGMVTIATNILYPHEVFSALFKHHPTAFLERLCGGSIDNVPSFWASMREHPNLAGHPFLSDATYAKTCIPLSLHGDGVPVSGIGKPWSKSAEVLSWSSCLGYGSTSVTTYMIICLHKLLMTSAPGHRTADKLWLHICWSFTWLMRGVWPDADAYGTKYTPGLPEYTRRLTPLADGWTAALWLLKGDLEYFANTLGLEHFSSHTPCFLCRANTSDVPWTDIRCGAQWQATVWTPETWRHHNRNTHPIFGVPGVSITSVSPDMLHSKHLGTDTYFYASVLTLLTRHMLPASPQNNLDRVWTRIQHHYKVMKIPDQFGNLAESMFWSPNSMPRLKGRASEMRNLAVPLRATFLEFRDATDQRHRWVLHGLNMSIRMEELLDNSTPPTPFTTEVHEEFLQAALQFAAFQNALADYYHPRNLLLFNVTIKTHYLLHIALQSKFVHPRAAWCYRGEDFMRISRRLIASCQHGAKPHLVCTKAVAKYLRGLSFAVLGKDCWRHGE